jgi:hypothetical protein
MSFEAREAAEAASMAMQAGISQAEVATLCLISVMYSLIEIAEALALLAQQIQEEP